jgi:hypothetical protein
MLGRSNRRVGGVGWHGKGPNDAGPLWWQHSRGPAGLTVGAISALGSHIGSAKDQGAQGKKINGA